MDQALCELKGSWESWFNHWSKRESQIMLQTRGLGGVLMPSDFLIGQLGGQLSPQVADEVVFNPRSWWRLIQNLVRIFWKQWREEFQGMLNACREFRDKKENLKVWDVVLVVDQNAPHRQWSLGWGEKVFPGQDGQVHVVQVGTTDHKFTCPITPTVSIECLRWSEESDVKGRNAPDLFFGGRMERWLNWTFFLS